MSAMTAKMSIKVRVRINRMVAKFGKMGRMAVAKVGKMSRMVVASKPAMISILSR